MSEQEQLHLNMALDYINALEAGATGEELYMYYHDDIIQVSYPCLFSPRLTARDLGDIADGTGKHLLPVKDVEYDVRKTFSAENMVVVEAVYTAVLHAPYANLPQGRHLKAYLSLCFEFRDNKIIRQRNYECFES